MSTPWGQTGIQISDMIKALIEVKDTYGDLICEITDTNEYKHGVLQGTTPFISIVENDNDEVISLQFVDKETLESFYAEGETF
mgnify:CR=1 FL=1